MKDLSVRHDIAVATVAIEREIRNGKMSISSLSSGEDILEDFAMNHSNYTLVTHGVGFHVDRGKGDNTSFLENRVVFTSKKIQTSLAFRKGGDTLVHMSSIMHYWTGSI